MTKHVFAVRGDRTLLDGQPFLVKGLRCSNALISDATTDELIENLALFLDYGVNTVSVYFMGSRFGDVKGYQEDASLSPEHAQRMGRIIQATDDLGMVVLVGCLYWGNSRAKWDTWKQEDANRAVANTVRWLAENDYRNVFVDVDNEGMALRGAGFDNRELLRAGKSVDSTIAIATNFRGDPPPEADLGIHFANPVPGKPYIETEGSPPNVPGGYWGPYSKQEGFYGYLNVGVYTEKMKRDQKAITAEYLRKGWGYMLASTWLQAAPPQGPNQCPGGYGTADDPGILWWLEFLSAEFRA